MPHIIVEHSADLDVSDLLPALHETLGAQDTIGLERIKTRSIPIHNVIIGDGSKGDHMIHIALKLLPGRPDDLRKKMASALHKTATNILPNISITVEVIALDEPSYTA